MITVAELIEKLKKFDGDLPVYVRGYEDGIDDATRQTEIRVCRDYYKETYYGKHETVAAFEDEDDYDTVTSGVIIGVAPEDSNG